MSWLHAMDVAVFRCINLSLQHPVLDAVMPFFAWNRFFLPALLLLLAVFIWRGGARGRVLVLMALVIIALGDAFVINTIKHAIDRPRPFLAIPEAHLLVGKGQSGSMPSSHVSSWFAVTLIGFVYYRRSWLLLLPVALVIAFSRAYVGVHYPSDILAGAILGMGYAAAGLWTFERLWRRVGPEWFPGWWARLPSLMDPRLRISPVTEARSGAAADLQWLRLGYVLIAVVAAARLLYIASGTIELSEDEAYQWLWSKHLALSYYSKPPLIAYTQFLGTALWGDTELGVRFFSPVIGAILSVLLLRFMARKVNPRAGFFLLLMMNTTPLLGVGSTLMTVDPLLVLFWTAAMIAGWRAVQPAAGKGDWLWVGLWMGLGLLSKYTAVLQLACWAVFFACWPPARRHLHGAGPYLALAIVALCALPILIWNAQHGWVTVEHVAMENAELGKTWRPTWRYAAEFFGSEAALLNPVYFGAMIWAACAFWKRRHGSPLLLYCFSMGAPVFLGYWVFTLHTRVMPNWIACAVAPLFCLAVAHWDCRWQEGVRAVKGWLFAGLALGGAAVLVLHDTNMIGKLTGQALPPRIDPLRRVRSWSETARVVETARQQLRREGKEVFVIGTHYGMVGQLSFYIPQAKTAAARVPLVYFRTSSEPANQFYFWPGYREQRRGENAIYVQETRARTQPSPQIIQEFDSVTDLGLYEIKYRGRVFRQVQLFACRNLH